MTMGIFSGCNFTGDGSKKYEITEEKPKIEAEGISVEFSAYDIDKKANVTMKEVQVTNIYKQEVDSKEIQAKAYDISTEDMKEFTDIIKISLDYDSSFIQNGDEEKNVKAAYFNEAKKEWEPVYFEVDKKNKKVNILTTHLSTYGVFTVKDENSRIAKIIDVQYAPSLPAGIGDSYAEIIQAGLSGSTDNRKAFELGFNAASDWLGISGAGLTAITQTVYATEFVNGLSNAFTNVGLAAAFVQAAYDFSKGDDVALYGNLTKNVSYFAVSKWGSSALQLGFVGVYAIDYSLNKFMNEAWDGRKEIWQRAYNEYYSKEKKMTDKDWYNKFYWIWQDSIPSKDPNLMKDRINYALNEYCNAFWNLPEEDQAFWQSEVQKTGFSGGGGLNEGLKEEISKAARYELIKRLQETVFPRLEANIRLKLGEDYRKELLSLRNYLNKKVNVTIIERLKPEEKSKLQGYILRFAPLNDDANKATWTGKVNSTGTTKTHFTILGHIQSGQPNKLLLFKPDKDPDVDKPEKVIEFKVTMPETKIYLNDMFPTMDEIAGVWDEVYMTFPDIVIPPKDTSSSSEEGECDLPLAIMEALKAAQIKCRIEIQKIDETNANFIFSATSGKNMKTGEALEIEPKPPVQSHGTYVEGIFKTNVLIDNGSFPMALAMKKLDDGTITMDYTGSMDIPESEGVSIVFKITGKRIPDAQ